MSSENNLDDSYAKMMLYYEYLKERNIYLRKEIFENQNSLTDAQKVIRELNRENERLQANLNLQDYLIYERENTNKIQDEQIKKAKNELEKIERLHELEVKIFETKYLEKSKMLMNLEQLPEDMKKQCEHTETELLLLKEELEIEQCSLQREENIEKVGDSDFYNLGDNQRHVLDLLVKEMDIFMQ